MRELKYDEVGGPGSAHPELEEIAAYLDGRLSAAERRGITAHLSVCTECLELFTETAHALEETSAGTAEGEVVPFAGRPSSVLHWLPYVAAAALIVAVGVVGYSARFAQPKLTLAQLLEPLQGTPQLAAAVWKPEATRGDAPEISDTSVLSCLAGAHLLGFQAAVAAGDSEVAGQMAQQVANQFEAVGLVDEQAQLFRTAQFALDDGAPTTRFAGLVEETAEAAEARFFPVHFDFGSWAEAGYIAARTGNRAWFERRANRRFLSYLLRQEDEQIDPQAGEELERIREVWDRGELRPAELAALGGQFEAILQRYQALSEQDTSFSEE